MNNAARLLPCAGAGTSLSIGQKQNVQDSSPNCRHCRMALSACRRILCKGCLAPSHKQASTPSFGLVNHVDQVSALSELHTNPKACLALSGSHLLVCIGHLEHISSCDLASMHHLVYLGEVFQVNSLERHFDQSTNEESNSLLAVLPVADI